jgi:L,D-peptidoglycan transpeptidase YkuD (ErfK/YbiS/YcfS/YnhG family)
MTIIIKNKETLLYDDFIFKCTIGKKGTKNNKIEGDNSTPKGTFQIGNIYYRSDRIKKPITKLKTIVIKKNMGWCDDPKSKFYNKPFNIKKKLNIRHEKLYRQDFKYDLLIVIKYNTKKIVKNKGSAIFLHLTKNYSPTRGCIAMNKKDFLILGRLINKKTKIKIN